MTALLSNQTVNIDFHKRRCPLPNWNDPSADIHLHKSRKNGRKKDRYEIRVPLNSDRDVTIDGNAGNVPQNIRKEIEDAFKDKKRRDEFRDKVASVLSNYPDFTSKDDTNANEALKRITSAFGLDWSNLISLSFTPTTKLYRAEISDETNRIYFVSIDKQRISAGDTSRIQIKD